MNWQVFCNGSLIRIFIDYIDLCDFVIDGEYMYKEITIVPVEV